MINLPETTPRRIIGDVEQLTRGAMRIPDALKAMGFSDFREGQKEPVYSLMAGLDTIVVMPTSLGKSLVYTTPVVCLDWRALVFSPLTALMQDQVQSLWRKNVRAAQLSGLQTDAENEASLRDWLAGKVQMLYIAPERMDNPKFRHAITTVKPDMFIVDEMHCLSQWSDNFRHHYCHIGDLIEELQPKVVCACTATCPKEVENDVRRVLRMQHARLWKFMPRRTNLHLSSAPFTGYQDLARRCLEVNGPCVVYCATQKEVEQCASQLQQLLPADDSLIPFHGGMPPSTKNANLQMFMSGKARVVVCTNAFGMGIDKLDIRGVIHRHFPGSPEAASQECGRGGRDGKDSWCTMLYDSEARDIQEYFFQMGNPEEDDIRRIFGILLAESGNGKRPVRLTQIQLANRAGIRDDVVSAIIEILSGAGCIARSSDTEKIAKIKLLQDPHGDDRFTQYTKIFRKTSTMDADGNYPVNLDFVAAEVGLTRQTVTNHLKNLQDEKKIEYIPPYRGAVTMVVGGIQLVDFERLKEKRKREREKLNKVIEYINTPDHLKHDWFEAYFEVNEK
jgi:ATP-dependent DNA helicase RecQ